MSGTKQLYRPQQGRILGGVCVGLADYFEVDPLLIRLLWILFIGFGWLYLILWLIIPSE